MAYVVALFTLLFLLPVTARAEGGYQITLQAEGEHGRVELYADSADAGQTVWLLAEPEEGYVAQFDGFSAAGLVQPGYVGLGLYAFDMPEGDVELEVRFVPAQGEAYAITGEVAQPGLGQLILHRAEAREGEWVTVEAVPRPGCVLVGLRAMGTDGLPVRGGYADTRDGVLIYEFCVPDVGIVVEAAFARADLRGLAIRERGLPRQVAALRFAGMLQ
jgi:hypothetical protein